MLPPLLAQIGADAMLLAAAALLGLAAAAVTPRLPRRRRLLVAVAAGGIGFQVFHFAEHLAQVGYWFANPTAAPWLSAWAEVGVDVLAAASDGRHGSGAELLHLVGNLIFLAGIAAALTLARRQRRPGTRLLRLALLLQGVHVAEHVLLTATWFATGRALGVTTAFGTLAADATAGIALRVWAHFGLNLVATVLALRGVQLAWGTARRPGAGSPQEPRERFGNAAAGTLAGVSSHATRGGTEHGSQR